MDFAYSQDQEAWRSTVRAFLDDQGGVGAARTLQEAGTEHDPRFWERIGQLGLHGLHIDELWGGQGATVEELAVTMEEFGRALVCSPYFASTVLAATALRRAVDADATGEAAKLIAPVCGGERIATVALWEADAGWEPFNDGVTAAPGAGSAPLDVVLAGEKVAVPYGGSADLMLVTAVDEYGPLLAAVDRQTSRSDPTVTAVSTFDLTSRLSRVRFTATPATVVARGGPAIAAVDWCAIHAQVLLAAEMIGGSQACLDAAVAYAKLREQFGRPIGSFQAIKHLCAEMLAELELARSSVLYAVWALRVHTAGSAVPASLRAAASAAKALASEAYAFCADAALHIHGGMGFTWEHDAHLYLRRATADSLLFGDATLHRDVYLQLYPTTDHLEGTR